MIFDDVANHIIEMLAFGDQIRMGSLDPFDLGEFCGSSRESSDKVFISLCTGDFYTEMKMVMVNTMLVQFHFEFFSPPVKFIVNLFSALQQRA